MNINFQWTEDMSVGEETIDKQHKKLLNQVNAVLEAIMNKSSKAEIEKTLTFLNRYVQEHFSYEEKYMKENRYPELEAHKLKHGNFAKNYKKFKNDFEKGLNPDILIVEIERFLGDWWVDHICHEDKKYSKYIIK